MINNKQKVQQVIDDILKDASPEEVKELLSSANRKIKRTKPKNKIKPEDVTGVHTKYCPKVTWFGVRKTKNDLTCMNCGANHMDDESDNVSLISRKGTNTTHVCINCANMYLTYDHVIDHYALQEEQKAKVEKYINAILSFDNSSYVRKGAYFSSYNLEDKKIEELETIHTELKLKYDESQLTEKLARDEYVDTPTEQYLIDDFDLFEDKKNLRHERQIESYFSDDYHDYFDCGQGYSQDDAKLFVKIGNKYYDVTLNAEIESSKQDRGDRLYWVESLSSVKYYEIAKPEPKTTETITLTLTVNDWQKQELMNKISELNINEN